MTARKADNQRIDHVPKLCNTCANLNLPCAKLDFMTEEFGDDVELEFCGWFAPRKADPAENPALAAAASNTVEAPATEPEDDKESTT